MGREEEPILMQAPIKRRILGCDKEQQIWRERKGVRGKGGEKERERERERWEPLLLFRILLR